MISYCGNCKKKKMNSNYSLNILMLFKYLTNKIRDMRLSRPLLSSGRDNRISDFL